MCTTVYYICIRVVSVHGVCRRSAGGIQNRQPITALTELQYGTYLSNICNLIPISELA